MLARAKTLLFGAILASLAAQALSGHINPYFLDVIIGIGINIILAVSLNLINGYTGQFSLGHAGFMAVGAYTSAAVSIFLGPHFLSRLGSGNVAIALLFFLALLAGGAVAAVTGLLVGAPSLRLRGDYLAIVTLGFGEIIRVIFRARAEWNSQLHEFILGVQFCGAHRVHRYRNGQFNLRPGISRRARQ
jgi:branched-chain amino acid transport system permease protein